MVEIITVQSHVSILSPLNSTAQHPQAFNSLHSLQSINQQRNTLCASQAYRLILGAKATQEMLYENRNEARARRIFFVVFRLLVFVWVYGFGGGARTGAEGGLCVC